MKNYVFYGDSHGDLDYTEKVAAFAAEHDAEMICVGDWGMIWPHRDTRTGAVEDRSAHQLETLSLALKRAGEFAGKPPVQMRFIDGNHDWHPKLAELRLDSEPTLDGGFRIAPNVVYQPRGSVVEDIDGTRFLFCGGAPSIDRALRTPGFSWWPEEVISEDEHRLAMSAEYPIHVLVTHDAPDYPPDYYPKGDRKHREESCTSMDMLRRLGDRFRPELHVHGHWHTRYTKQRGETKIVGLNCNYASFNDAVMLWSRDGSSR